MIFYDFYDYLIYTFLKICYVFVFNIFWKSHNFWMNSHFCFNLSSSCGCVRSKKINLRQKITSNSLLIIYIQNNPSHVIIIIIITTITRVVYDFVGSFRYCTHSLWFLYSKYQHFTLFVMKYFSTFIYLIKTCRKIITNIF